MHGPAQAPEAQLWHTVQAMNEAWLNEDGRRLAGIYAEDAVLLAGDDADRLCGRESCVRREVQLRRAMEVERFRLGPPKVDVYDETAVVSYCFVLAWRTGGGCRHEERGLDVVVLRRCGEQWRVVSRTVLPAAADAPRAVPD